MKRKNPTRKLVYGEDPEYGGIGLRPAEHPEFNYLQGMSVAHDLLEHFPSDKGTLADEFMALGASLYVRGHDYYAAKGRSDANAESNIAADLINMFNYWQSGQFPEGPLFSAPKTKRIPEEDFDKKRYLDEAYKYIGSDIEEENESEYKKFVKATIPWLEKGYWKAATRYRKINRSFLPEFFIHIENTIDEGIRKIQN